MPKDRRNSAAANEPFKRAVTGVMRAIAGEPELAVAFGTDRANLQGTNARLPEPPRRMSEKDVAVTRGHSDALALRLACHDPAVHRTYRPEGQNARAAFDAVEQARVEAIGARRMGGVAENLTAMITETLERQNPAEMSTREEAPRAQALALIVREQLSGLAPPDCAKGMVGAWRQWIEDKAGDDIRALSDTLDDQRGFAHALRDLLAHLDMGDELGSDPDEAEESDEDQQDEAGENEAQEGGESEATEAASFEDGEDRTEDQQEGLSETAERDAEGTPEDQDGDDARQASDPWRPNAQADDERLAPGYRIFTSQFDEMVKAEELCDGVELDRL
ncbi:MAG TPA: cobaltochelatase subunit CobT, partial [Hyphomicrobiales bacterium]|nr:cobaltochelatase subunit CobT [Hyphomicrobiales bacterium]